MIDGITNTSDGNLRKINILKIAKYLIYSFKDSSGGTCPWLDAKRPIKNKGYLNYMPRYVFTITYRRPGKNNLRSGFVYFCGCGEEGIFKETVLKSG